MPRAPAFRPPCIPPVTDSKNLRLRPSPKDRPSPLALHLLPGIVHASRRYASLCHAPRSPARPERQHQNQNQLRQHAFISTKTSRLLNALRQPLNGFRRGLSGASKQNRETPVSLCFFRGFALFSHPPPARWAGAKERDREHHFLKLTPETDTMNKDIYQQITDKIIAALETGTAPWVKPWASCGAPRNAITCREYSGINTILLAMAPHANPLWLTFNQAKAAGGAVRKGECGTQVVFFKPLKITDRTNAENEDKVIPLLRSFTVFNVQQIDNLPEKYTQAVQPQMDSFADNEKAEALLAQAIIEHGKSSACFIPSADVIHMPNKTDFKTIPDYYATGLHELTHWSGHKSRLAREFGGRFGDCAYAFEELIAELGAAFMCAHCNIDGQLQHDSYIASWLKVLHADKRAIFTAAAAARKAAEFLTGATAEEENQAAA